MAPTQRLYDRGTQLGNRRLATFGEDCHHQRLLLGLTQQQVADGARIDRGTYSLIERGQFEALTVVVAARIAAVLGLDLSVKTYPGGPAIRDAGQAPRLGRLLSKIGRPLQYRVEATLPSVAGRFEQRCWDLAITGHGERTTCEFEAALYDVQAQRRRHNLKLRDDPPDHFLLVVADTRANRRVMREQPEHFADLPRLRTANVLGALTRGEHPPTGWMFL
jgi:transcriptional regulator with XRE-family HTH domain